VVAVGVADCLGEGEGSERRDDLKDGEKVTIT
jgi:hypothetical protein